jgi:peptidoglycan/LPS O-acetylase OafA/YrhL
LLTFIITVAFTELVPGTAPLDLRRGPFGFWFYWAIGAYVAETWQKHDRSAFWHHRWLTLVLVPLWIGSVYCRPLSRHQWMISALLSGVLLDWSLAKGRVWGGRVVRLISAIGLVSYSMYLWHQPMLDYISRSFLSIAGLDATPAVMFGVCLPVCFLVIVVLSALSYRFLELPSVRAGRWFWSSIARTPASRRTN